MMKLIAQWIVDIPRSSDKQLYGKIQFRLSKDDKTYVIERREQDRLGGERWVEVKDWSHEQSLKNDGVCAILGAGIEVLADQLEKFRAETEVPVPATARTSDRPWKRRPPDRQHWPLPAPPEVWLGELPEVAPTFCETLNPVAELAATEPIRDNPADPDCF